MELGEVRVAMDSDFEKMKSICDNHDNWKIDYNKNNTKVWTKSTEVTDFKMIKVYSSFKDISAPLLYDVLHDSDYRKQWDRNMIDCSDICSINPNNNIGYYSLKCPAPLKNRDFVMQCSWLETGKEYMLLNHSVNHQAKLPTKSYVRGTSYLTGYLVRVESKGCSLYYVTQSDPKGHLPSWAVNKLTTLFAPKIMQRIHKACRGYDAWKKKHNPNMKPWLNPEQITLPKLNIDDILTSSPSSDSLDESNLRESDITLEEFDKALDD